MTAWRQEESENPQNIGVTFGGVGFEIGASSTSSSEFSESSDKTFSNSEGSKKHSNKKSNNRSSGHEGVGETISDKTANSSDHTEEALRKSLAQTQSHQVEEMSTSGEASNSNTLQRLTENLLKGQVLNRDIIEQIATAQKDRNTQNHSEEAASKEQLKESSEHHFKTGSHHVEKSP